MNEILSFDIYTIACYSDLREGLYIFSKFIKSFGMFRVMLRNLEWASDRVDRLYKERGKWQNKLKWKQ